ncbi:hypothetical protein F511_45312 [Dorcoceras hygrometricum]|uniref:Uncharacterized protein n=1 Tax=Dorcoceras hygrometricum TaxID=472368 RepID=A0A2Z7A3I8_9LAMI|nr:hypothetical protein F511_45312 [Dorcoceras hygrometricum]
MTSPEHRRSGGRPAATTRKIARRRTMSRATSRGQHASRATSLIVRSGQRKEASTSSAIAQRTHAAIKRHERRDIAEENAQQRRYMRLPLVRQAHGQHRPSSREAAPSARQRCAMITHAHARSGAHRQPLLRGQRASRAHECARGGADPRNTGSDTTVGDPDPPPVRQRKNNKHRTGKRSIRKTNRHSTTFIGCFSVLPRWHLCLTPTGVSRTRLFSVDCGSYANPVHDQIRDSFVRLH